MAKELKDKDKITYISYSSLTPFGNVIFDVTISPAMVNKLNAICDKVLEDKKQRWGHKLVGNIEDEWLIPNDVLADNDILEYFLKIAALYKRQSDEEARKMDSEKFIDNKMNIQAAWVNEMKKYEYNPVHFHTNCNLSSILYLKVPDFASKPILKDNYPNKRNVDGHTEFISHSFFPDTGDRGNLIVKPVVGKFYIFPAGLQHTVYPFGCEGTRRTMAINFN